ncbi:hypothetical protein B296_00000146 [Ensete ventricosum]|uniref:BZIP domain-containing protein n=1 Tax=Ensete ventricosum TaxID=4639 RepID=A0A427B717_ENSVE|nr:hypothetical protein B296_00000146 [Ensete ventricosum]
MLDTCLVRVDAPSPFIYEGPAFVVDRCSQRAPRFGSAGDNSVSLFAGSRGSQATAGASRVPPVAAVGSSRGGGVSGDHCRGNLAGTLFAEAFLALQRGYAAASCFRQYFFNGKRIYFSYVEPQGGWGEPTGEEGSFCYHGSSAICFCSVARRRSTRTDVASPSESRKMTSEDAEVTSGHRDPDLGHRQLIRPEERDQTAGSADRELDHGFALTAQISDYSLARDEIQNAACEPRKTFGSMNMDEFLTNICNVEEIQAAAAAANNDSSNNQAQAGSTAGGGQVVEAAAPLSRKTVDEVWAEIHRNVSLRSHHVEQQVHQDGAGNACRQPTFGEMTLEDFLVKAGVVREGHGAPSPHPQPMALPPSAAQQYEITGFGHMVGMTGYVDEQVLGAAAAVVGSPASPLSSDGMAGEQVDNSVPGYGADVPRIVGGVGRKRPGDGETVDRVVERRQRRMIKNRESAARSRARKQVHFLSSTELLSHHVRHSNTATAEPVILTNEMQCTQAYTVELEAELNVLKEENARLREEQVNDQVRIDNIFYHQRC